MSEYSGKTNSLIIASAEALKANPEWRWGQAVYNTAYEWYPEIVRGTPLCFNPYNDDGAVDVFLRWLKYEQGYGFHG